MLVRIVEAEIISFKNVEHGSIQFANYSAVQRRAVLEKTDIEGIYGQNGSGKTALVEAMGILRDILAGRSVQAKTYGELIAPDGSTVFRLKFFIEADAKKYLADYEVNILPPRQEQEPADYLPLFREKLTYLTRGATWKGRRQLSVKNIYYDMDNILEQSTPSISRIPADCFADVSLLEHPEKIILIGSQKGTSVFFNGLLEKQLTSMESPSDDAADLRNVLSSLHMFAFVNFQVVKVNQLGAINLKTFLPLMIHEKTTSSISYSNIMLSLKEDYIEKDEYELLQKALPSLNIALSALIPNLKVEIRETERTVQDDKTFVHVSIEAIRRGKRFSIRYESEGIQRIISLLSYLIALYNDPQICLVVDEFDDGIFEYLLGELIGVLGKEARGQLIFTSHNLRVLEKLDHKRILCTTTNPQNRYIHLSGVGANNNKRDFYIRSIIIGGQQEELYDAADLEDISASFRRAYSCRTDEQGANGRSKRLNELNLAT